jgi:molecular chaperone HtpG
MRTKQFKAESKKLLDMMINSIYTHKEIFLRELISNASDAMDKLYYHSLSEGNTGLSRNEMKIAIALDKDARTITITDNGCGMTAEELEQNLGTIAKSGSLDFKAANEKQEDVDIIGQFGVGFYSAFMVSDCVTVESKAFGSDEAWKWASKGADGYTIEPCDKADYGTTVTLHIKPPS